MQALYSQRNIAANAQRKYTVGYTVVATDEAMTIVSGHPVELKDVLLYAPSPSGVLPDPAEQDNLLARPTCSKWMGRKQYLALCVGLMPTMLA